SVNSKISQRAKGSAKTFLNRFMCLISLNYILATVQNEFDGRSRRPAKNPFNAVLNYCYGMLYGLVEKACILAGLDPYIGFLHADDYNKKSLVFDLIEPFRIYGEQTAVYLFTGKKVHQEVRSFSQGKKRDKEENLK
ncbi:MAG: CRISPR-associated endonuclease Cas1, partial [Deltaproteobacteria bacterium]|nr:CRISPR-associated endonuclease Cas1 [Deltaproteobacteria bacterium]MBW2138683.1 CRISPR-associated endonuclease Cas1 [Deltaproteobacteria bacterium]